MNRPEGPAVVRTGRAGLREDAAHLRLIADSIPAMTIAYDERLICTFANRRFAEFFGLTTETILGRHLREIIGEAPYREVKPYFDRVLAGERTTYKRTRVMASGERRFLEVELIPHVAPGGRRRGLFAVTTDVTERRREEQLRTLALSVPGLIANAETTSAAIRSVIRAICESEQWECGRYVRAEGDGVMRQVDAWGIDDPAVQRFLERSKPIEHRPGVGLTGIVFETGQPLWAADVSKDPRALRRGQTQELMLRGAFVFPVHADGRLIGLLAFNSRERRDPDERVLSAILAIGSQIGQFLERKRVEEELRRFRAAMDASADIIVLVDPMTVRYVDANATACRMLGYTREELLRTPPEELVGVPREKLAAEFASMMTVPGSLGGMVGTYRRKDGSTFPFESTRRLVRSGDGVLIAAISRDISERVAAERALRDSEARFRTLIESANEGILVYDQEMRIVSANGAVERMLGLAKEKLVGAPGFVSLVPCIREDGTPVTGETRAPIVALRSGRALSGQVVGIRRDSGHITWLQANTALLYDAGRSAEKGDAPYGAVATLTDITALKRGEALLRLEQRVARAFDTQGDPQGALRAAIQAVCESERWDCGRYLEVASGELRAFSHWSIDDPAVLRYLERVCPMTYAPGFGLVGRAWQAREPIWVRDIGSDPRAANPGLALEMGARAALVVPVLALDAVIGVFIFHGREAREPDERLLQAMQLIGGQIGQLLRRARAENAVRESEARFRSLCALSSDVFWEQDEQFRFTVVSDASGAIDARHMLGKARWELDATNLTAEDWAAHRALIEAHRPFRDLEICGRGSDGKEVWHSVSGEPMFDASGRFTGYRGVGRDITARKLDERRIRHLASHDALTGLPNRTAFSELLNAAREGARRRGRSLAVMFVDLDRFKVINDTLGHEAGDEVLCEVARRLRHTLRASDVVARLGGDEFVVMLPELDATAQAETAARKVLGAMLPPMTVAGRELSLTASVGICLYPQDGEDEQSLMKNADAAMYRAKEAGKNNFKFHHPATDRRSLERLAMETSLRRALGRREFFLHYQPRISLASGAVTGVEALARWRHPELGIVPPAEFIALAEETGAIHDLGRWVLEAACAQAAEWQKAGLPPLRMAVNISARQFGADNLAAQVGAALEASGLAPDRLELEITESVVAQSIERAAQVLAGIRALGVRVALDDFGTGYSSLAQLKRFPIDTIKVDRAFVAELPHKSEDAAIARAIIAMGKSLRLVVVAEGVETAEQHAFLRAHGCDELQGYLVSRPLAAEDCAAFLARFSEPRAT